MMRAVLNCFLICVASFVYCQDDDKILQTAKEKNRPIVALFLNSQECPWSLKLQTEVVETPLFREKIDAEAALWLAPTKDQTLLQKYRVQNYPQILLLDPQGKEFARLDYLPLDAEGYAAEICSLIDDFNEVCIALDQNTSAFEEGKWQELLQKAKKLSVPYFSQVMLDRGVQLEKGNFFHLEKLAFLLEKHKLKHPQVIKLKKQLLERDPKNLQGAHSKVAVLEFQKIASRLKPGQPHEKALSPLLEYVEKFGKKDPDLWKIEMVIADFLFTKNDRALALEYAEAAMALAPDADKLKIAETIAYMETK
jgi:hypothetical protein